MESDLGKLFIGGISWDTNEDRLREYFESFGEVVEAVIMKDRNTGRARGFGFVVFADPTVAERVVMEKHMIDGRMVEAKKAVPRDDQHILKRNSSNAHGSPAPARTKKIFVGGLASTVTEADFKKYFDQFGTITDVVVMYDHNTQRPRGFGFITFDSEDAVDKVLVKTFHELNGKMVEVKKAVPKELSPGPSMRLPIGTYNYGLNRVNSFLNGYTQGYSPIQRCLQYKIEAKHKRRIQITVSLSGNMNVEVQKQDVLPLHVLLGRPVADVTEHSAVYQLSRACAITTFNQYGKKDQVEANFVIPEIKKLASDARVQNLNIILISSGEPKGASGENHLSLDHEELTSFPNIEGNCLWGKIPIDSLCSSLERCVTLSLGHKAEMLSTVNMHPCSLEPKFLNQDNCMTFCSHNVDPMNSYQVQVSICAQEIGAIERSPYDSYSYNDVPTSSLPHIIRLRTGNVLFNYRYYNNTLQKTEVTEDFSCPFCLVRCASFKGLRYHLTSSHDLFNFEFWVTEEYQAVNVSVRTDIWRSELFLRYVTRSGYKSRPWCDGKVAPS